MAPLYVLETPLTTSHLHAEFPHKRVCIFVDGENFRFSLGKLFGDSSYDFSRHDYLPVTDWHGFFQSLIDRPGWELVRVYWYVTREIDFWPYIPYEWDKKRKVLQDTGIMDKLRNQGYEFSTNNQGLKDAELELNKRRQEIQKHTDGRHKIHSAIERQCNQIQFQRFGAIRYDLVERSFGTEKGVDTQLATDLIVFRDNYDVVMLVSGDADYIPPVSAVKNMGKLVYSVCFLTEDGAKLPGGAWRLERSVDGQIELPFDQVRDQLGINRETIND